MTSVASSSHGMGFHSHDHATCVSEGLRAAVEHSERLRLNLTPVRRKVLEILLEEHKAMGAYAVLDRLRDAGFGSQPPVAYRALDFLVQHGFAHKIERLNAFVACTHPGADHDPLFMICTSCEAVSEASTHQTPSPLSGAAKASGFVIARTMVEAEGLCPKCADQDTP